MNIRRRLTAAAICWVIVSSEVHAAPGSEAAAPACSCDHRHSAPPERHHPDWTGVWVRVGSVSDPRVKHDYAELPPPPTDETDWPPLTESFRAKYRVITQALARGERLNDPTANCLPAGFPWMMNMPYPMEIHQSPTQLTIIAEWLSQTRRIYIGA